MSKRGSGRAPIPGMTRSRVGVVDLPGLRRAIAALLTCYDAHLDGTVLGPGAIARARDEIDRHLPVPGRLGRDLAVMLEFQPGRDPREVAESIERLRRVGSQAGPPPSPTFRARRRFNRELQPTLPGLGESELA